eukprot:477290-Ditylum_brightwellii.AAC.1
MSPQTLCTCVHHGLSFECAQMLKSVPTQGQRVNTAHPTNSKGTHKWEAGESITLCLEGKAGGSAVFKPLLVHA